MLDAGIAQRALRRPDRRRRSDPGARAPRPRAARVDAATVPEPYRSQMGRVTAERTVPALKAFLEGGGTIVAIGPSTALAAHLRLPITSALVDADADRRPAAEAGGVLHPRLGAPGARSIRTQPLAWGMPAQADVYFDNSPVFRLGPDAASRGVTPIAWFDSPTPLRSGWAWGQHYLDGGICDCRGPGGQGPAGAVRTGDHVPRPAARDVQVPVQRPAQTRIPSRHHSSTPAGRDLALAAAQQAEADPGRVVTGELPLGWDAAPSVP